MPNHTLCAPPGKANHRAGALSGGRERLAEVASGRVGIRRFGQESKKLYNAPGVPKQLALNAGTFLAHVEKEAGAERGSGLGERGGEGAMPIVTVFSSDRGSADVERAARKCTKFRTC